MIDSTRARIATAVGRVLARGGGVFPGTREIAAEAGVTTGALQHHFRTKDEMLLFALRHHGRLLEQRLRARFAAGAGEAASPRRVLAGIVEELLPRGPERVAEASVGLAFVLRAAADPALAATYRTRRGKLHAFVRRQFERAEVRDPAGAADVLLFAVEGMRTDCVLLGEVPPGADALLDRLLTP